jgi:hypothetical protein
VPLEPTARHSAGEHASPRDRLATTPERDNAPLFIVASPRPQTGKTFLARLIVDYLRLDRADLLAFDINPAGDSLREYLPSVARRADLGVIADQMALFDGLVSDDGVTKVIDVGYGSFERFFQIAEQIGIFAEREGRSLDSFVLFPADAHPISAISYAQLRRRFESVVVVPIFNEAIAPGKKLRVDFPFCRAAAVPLQISPLAPMLKAQLEQSNSSFLDFYEELPPAIPAGLAYELRSWTRRTFIEFRELELRLLLEKLRWLCRACGSDSVTFERDQRAHRHGKLAQPLRPAEVRQVNDETGGENLRAELAQQLDCTLGGAPRGDEIIDQNDPIATFDRILMHFDLVESVFERVGHGNAFVRELALFTDRDKACRNLMRDSAAQDEPARLNPCDLVDLRARPRLHQFVHGAPERPRVPKERGYVPEHDSRLGVIRNGADRCLQIVLELDADHASSQRNASVAIKPTLAKHEPARNHARLDG